MLRNSLISVGTAWVLGILFFTSTAFSTEPEPGQPSGFTAGSPYSFRPLIPNWALTAQPPPPPRYERLGDSPIFMTSINYPGIYGAHVFGVTPTSYYDQAPYFVPSPSSLTASTLMASASAPTSFAPETLSATINVRVPTENADLSFNQHRTFPTGTIREFVTPTLRPGRNYMYNVRVSWIDGDLRRARDKNVFVLAGDQIEVDLTTGRGTFEGPSLRVIPRHEDTSTLRTRPIPATETDR